MTQGFRGFAPAVFQWFEGLEDDNSREYFQATRELYESEVRGGLEAMLEELAGEFGGDVKIFRQHRDLRFSQDKSPYKTTTYGLIYNTAAISTGLYAQLSSRGLYAGTGYYRMSRDQLVCYRAAVDDEAAGSALGALMETARAEGLTVDGQGVRTAPRGYRKDHPRIEQLRMTSVIVGRSWDGHEGVGREAALSGVSAAWRAAGRVVEWFDQHVGRQEVASSTDG